jgi:hypothetical protein
MGFGDQKDLALRPVHGGGGQKFARTHFNKFELVFAPVGKNV